MLHVIARTAQTVQERLYAKLHEMRQERGKPINYRSLALSPTALEYVDLGNRVHVEVFANIVAVEFVREEAMFPCMYGPYLETKWTIRAVSGKDFEVMDEAPHRKKLLAAFSSHLPKFDLGAATEGLGSNDTGRWLCFRSQHP